MKRTIQLIPSRIAALGSPATFAQLRGLVDALAFNVPEVERESVRIDMDVRGVEYEHTLTPAEEAEALRNDLAAERTRVAAALARFRESRSREVWELIAAVREAVGIEVAPTAPGPPGAPAPPLDPYGPEDVPPTIDLREEWREHVKAAGWKLPGHELELYLDARRMGIAWPQAAEWLGLVAAERDAVERVARERGA